MTHALLSRVLFALAGLSCLHKWSPHARHDHKRSLNQLHEPEILIKEPACICVYCIFILQLQTMLSFMLLVAINIVVDEMVSVCALKNYWFFFVFVF